MRQSVIKERRPADAVGVARRRARGRCRLLLSPLLPLLLVAFAAMLGLNASSAAAGGGLETRVRAFDHITVDAVGQPSSERPASVGCLRPSQPSVVSGSCVATEAATSTASSTTRTGVVRNNPADWRRTRDVWDNAGLDDILSDANRKAIAGGRSPVVDDAWVKHFPGDEALMGERISPHHLGGGPITAPLPASRHLDAHMPGGFRYNPGGPGATG